MATQKKKKPARSAKRRAKPKTTPKPKARGRKLQRKAKQTDFITPRQELLAPEPLPERNGKGVLLIAVALLIVLAVAYQRWRRQAESAPSTLPSAQALTPPPGRDVAPSVPKQVAATKPETAAPAPIRRETAAPRARVWQPAKGPLTLRAWRASGQIAEAMVFRQGKPALIKLASETGATGFVDLRWDGKDAQGKPAPAGLYYVRLSGQGSWGVEQFRLQR